MTIVNIHNAKTNLSKLINEVETTGEVVIICRYGKAVVKLVPADTTKKSKLDLIKKHPILSKGKILGNITGPLPPEDWGSLI